jgi:hypothetical protein
MSNFGIETSSEIGIMPEMRILGSVRTSAIGVD